MRKYAVETPHYLMVVLAHDEHSALSKVKQELGTNAGPFYVRLATGQDISWFEGMGGCIT